MNHVATAAKPAAPRASRPVLKLGSKIDRAPAVPAPVVVIVPSAPSLYPLGRLMRAAENVRHTRIEEDCEPLADDIVAHGLLQSLIGYEDGAKIEVVEGGRRLKALRIVRDRGLIDDDFPVPVLIRGVDEAVELSLAENLQQRTMSPVDEFFAFAALMKRGDTSPAGLAKRFGWKERTVKQRLRLAELAKPVLDALADRAITLDAAMAYATSQDRALQEEVFAGQAKRGRTAHDPSSIRHSLRMKGLDTADPLFRFVGAEIYERDGGGYEDDLFVDPGKDRVLDRPFVLETAANRMVDVQAVRPIGELQRGEAWAPTIVGHVKVPDLRLHGWGFEAKLRPPAGFALVSRADHAKLWRTIRNNGLNAHIVVGIDVAGQLIADPRYAFVPAAQKAAVEKPALVDVAEDRERSVASARELEIIRWSRRLAVHPFAGTPYEGRAFWTELHADRQTAATVDGVEGFMVGVQIFVSQDEAAAQRKAAIALVDERAAAKAVS